MRPAHRARGLGDRSLFLNTHLAEFLGTKLRLDEISRPAKDEHRQTEDRGNHEHGDLLSYFIKQDFGSNVTSPDSTVMNLPFSFVSDG